MFNFSINIILFRDDDVTVAHTTEIPIQRTTDVRDGSRI